MALFQKNPHTNSEHQSLYSLGLNKTMLVVGLGNPGKKYDKTRHNIGFECLDHFSKALEFAPWANKKDLKSLITTQTMGAVRVILCKPTTFMNLSGQAVQAVAGFYKIPANQIIVVHDELDIPFGQIRTRTGGSSAGHNGIKSLLEHLDNEFGRIRIGAGNKPAQGEMDSADFVLAKFTKDEQAHMNALIKEVTSLLTESIYGGQLTSETRSFII